MPLAPRISVIIPTHNPHSARLHLTLEGLRVQSLPPSEWEAIIVDNDSNPPLIQTDLQGPPNLRLVHEERLGLSHARRRGLSEAVGDICIFVDDDNVLDSDYLRTVLDIFASHPRVGAIGGKSLPAFETQPKDWHSEFFPLLALRDEDGPPHISQGLRPVGAERNQYPVDAAPLGAGMAVRRPAIQPWCDRTTTRLTDRRGSELTSAGDNDIVFSILENGWEVGCFPALSLTHLIPAARLETTYLAALNRGIQKSWIQVLRQYDACPWQPISRFTLPLRKLKAWVVCQAWSGPAAFIRWQGRCGHFEGLLS